MSGKTRPLAALALTAMVTLVSACGTSPAADTGSSSSGGGSNTAARFSQCMRDNGVSAFPDPDASGQLTIDGVANGSSVDPSSAAFQQALSACKSLEPSGFTGHTRSAQQQAAALKFAQCIRDNGVPDFPDPSATDPLVDTNRIPSAATDSGIGILNAAMKKCGSYASAAGVPRSQ